MTATETRAVMVKLFAARGTAPMISRTWILLAALVWGGPAGAHAQSWSASRVDSHAPLGVMERPYPRGRRVDAVVPCYADGDGRQPHRHRPSPGRWRAGRLSCHTVADAHGHVHGGRHVRTHRSPDAGGHGACAGHLDGSSDANGHGVHDRVRRHRRRPDVGTGWAWPRARASGRTCTWA